MGADRAVHSDFQRQRAEQAEGALQQGQKKYPCNAQPIRARLCQKTSIKLQIFTFVTHLVLIQICSHSRVRCTGPVPPPDARFLCASEYYSARALASILSISIRPPCPKAPTWQPSTPCCVLIAANTHVNSLFAPARRA